MRRVRGCVCVCEYPNSARGKTIVFKHIQTVLFWHLLIWTSLLCIFTCSHMLSYKWNSKTYQTFYVIYDAMTILCRTSCIHMCTIIYGIHISCLMCHCGEWYDAYWYGTSDLWHDVWSAMCSAVSLYDMVREFKRILRILVLLGSRSQLVRTA